MHAAHVAADVAVAAAVCTLPAAHAPCGKHIAWLVPEVNVPAAQGAQVWSRVADGVLSTWVPAAQTVNGAQTVALEVVEKVPLAQPAHVRSETALPGADSNSPARQSVHAVQLVPSPAAEKVPSEQVPASVFPPDPDVHETANIAPTTVSPTQPPIRMGRDSASANLTRLGRKTPTHKQSAAASHSRRDAGQATPVLALRAA